MVRVRAPIALRMPIWLVWRLIKRRDRVVDEEQAQDERDRRHEAHDEEDAVERVLEEVLGRVGDAAAARGGAADHDVLLLQLILHGVGDGRAPAPGQSGRCWQRCG